MPQVHSIKVNTQEPCRQSCITQAAAMCRFQLVQSLKFKEMRPNNRTTSGALQTGCAAAGQAPRPG